MKRFLTLFLAGLLAIASLSGCGNKAEDESLYSGEKGVVTDRLEMKIKGYDKVIAIELYGNDAPITVTNFKKLCSEGFYDGLTFIRIQKDFVIQGGDPGVVSGHAQAKSIKGEFASNGVENTIAHKKGVLSMARTTAPNSASSQFFIMIADYSGLDGEYAAFGAVSEGMDVIDSVVNDYIGFGDPTYMGFIYDSTEQPVIEYIKVVE